MADDARYRATGKRKTAIARVILKPGTGAYLINGRTLDEFFPRATLQKTIRQPLETVGYEDRMDVIARMHGGGVSAQAGALRHGISRALLEADPNLRTELKRRGFLTRDARAKERKKAGLKKARKKPQFSKR
ncbi:MAG TPA: 30S ribosomal protein S9 [Solirubrobacteraceae bacterium]|nr:30S ribosomal protein S9 [Solirubrobacteraceae bacterium]